ncbi:MAG TPA: Asd/ArgC dimerization domain-containing protein [Marinobacterium sp.]|nr:Asd/ArgC dimerization domain-containing protein [Marinobacterium sp.]
MSKKVLLLGISALAGEQLLDLLEDHPLAKEVIFELFDTEEEAGRSLMVNGSAHRVRRYESIDLTDAKLAILCSPQIPADVISSIAPKVSLFDLHSREQTAGAELLLSGVAKARLELQPGTQFRSPEPALLVTALLLKTLSAAAEPLRVTATLMLPASLHDQPGIQALAAETAHLLNGREASAKLLDANMAFNLIAQPQPVDENGSLGVERLFAEGLAQLLGADDLEVNASAVQVPLFHGTAVTLAVELTKAVELNELVRLIDREAKLRFSPGASASTQSATGIEECLVSRLRFDAQDANVLLTTLLFDEQRLGRASNAVDALRALVTAH